MNFKVMLLITCLAISITQPAYAETDSDSGINFMLVTAKLAGACGMLKQLSYFQETTKLENGDAFIGRFFMFEAARFGMSVKEYLTQCKKALSIYTELSAQLDTK